MTALYGTRSAADIFEIAAFVDAMVGETSDSRWEQELPELHRMWNAAGHAAYGHFTVKLFRPVEALLTKHGLVCEPRLPGNLKRSEERWGDPRHRERLIWSIVSRNGRPLGALVTRFFHDHAMLRLPAAPSIIGINAVDHASARRLVVDEAASWPSIPTRPRTL